MIIVIKPEKENSDNFDSNKMYFSCQKLTIQSSTIKQLQHINFDKASRFQRQNELSRRSESGVIARTRKTVYDFNTSANVFRAEVITRKVSP